MKIFEAFEKVSGMKRYKKRPLIVHAKQMRKKFRVNSIEGNYILGKVGDYLLKGIEGELYICNKNIFEKTYDWIEE